MIYVEDDIFIQQLIAKAGPWSWSFHFYLRALFEQGLITNKVQFFIKLSRASFVLYTVSSVTLDRSFTLVDQIQLCTGTSTKSIFFCFLFPKIHIKVWSQMSNCIIVEKDYGWSISFV